MTSLPLQSTPFIGRTDELAEIAQRLGDPACRLLTLVGPGGIGKTRVSLEAAAQHEASGSKHGLYFVSLAEINAAELIVQAIAEAVKLSLLPGVEPKQQLLDYLSAKQMLLVLDNFEHLLAGANIVVDLLQAAPDVKILVTSRERLNLQGETVFHVGGMAYPKQEVGSDAAAYGAVHLFLDGVRRVRPEMLLTDQALVDASRICRQVQGMPLAIVLASAWSDTLSLAEIALELDRSVDFLEVETRDVPVRHRSIRAVFDHSWQILSEDERAAFIRLSVFRGSFTREAITAVTGASLRVLAALVNKSLLQHEAAGRYRMHELLRQYADEKLAASAERRTAQDRHCGYYAEFMKHQWSRLNTGQQRNAVDDIEAEMSNVLVAWRYMVENTRANDIRQTMNSLSKYLDLRCQFQEGVTLFGQSAEALQSVATTPNIAALQGCLMAYHGWFLNAVGRPEQGIVLAQKSLDTAREVGGPDDVIVALLSLMICQSFLNQRTALQSTCEEGLKIARAIGDQPDVAIFLYFLGYAICLEGEYKKAKEYGEEALEIVETAGEIWLRASICTFLLADVARRTGDYAMAKRLAEQSKPLFQAAGQVWGIAMCLGALGDIALEQREFEEAEHNYQQQLKMFIEAGQQPQLILDTAFQFARLMIAQGRKEQATALLTFIYNQPLTLKGTRDEILQLIIGMQTQLAAERFASAQERGQALDFEAVIADLLQDKSEVVLAPRAATPTGLDTLSARELEVLHLVADGLTNAEIAQKLYLSVGTVKVHTRNLYGKLGVSSRTQAVIEAQRLKLL